MHTQAEEQRSIDLLCDVQNELANALNSLGGKQGHGLFDNYNFHSANHVNRAAEGFIFLRKSGRIDASKFFVRPVIEMMFRLEAVRRKPELLYRIAYSETVVEDAKWIRPAAVNSSAIFDEVAHKKHWDAFKAKYATWFPTHTLSDVPISIWEIANAADMAGYYNSHYRTYCRYTHAALRAIGDFLSDLTDPEDNRTMAFCAFTVLNVVASMGAESPNLQSLYKRLTASVQPL